MLRDTLERVRDSYAIGRAAFSGEKIPEMAEPEDMGDIVITGDIHTNQETKSPPPLPQKSNSVNKMLAIAALLGAAGTGAAIPLAWQAWSEKESQEIVTPAGEDTDTQYQLKLLQDE